MLPIDQVKKQNNAELYVQDIVTSKRSENEDKIKSKKSTARKKRFYSSEE